MAFTPLFAQPAQMHSRDAREGAAVTYLRTVGRRRARPSTVRDRSSTSARTARASSNSGIDGESTPVPFCLRMVGYTTLNIIYCTIRVARPSYSDESMRWKVLCLPYTQSHSSPSTQYTSSS